MYVISSNICLLNISKASHIYLISRENEAKRLSRPYRPYSLGNPYKDIFRSLPILEIQEDLEINNSVPEFCSSVQSIRRLFILQENIETTREVHVTLFLGESKNNLRGITFGIRESVS